MNVTFTAMGLPRGRRSVASSVEFEANMLPKQLALSLAEKAIVSSDRVRGEMLVE